MVSISETKNHTYVYYTHKHTVTVQAVTLEQCMYNGKITPRWDIQMYFHDLFISKTYRVYYSRNICDRFHTFQRVCCRALGVDKIDFEELENKQFHMSFRTTYTLFKEIQKYDVTVSIEDAQLVSQTVEK